MKEAKKYFKNLSNKITYCKNPYETAENSDALVILTEWNQFRALDLVKIQNSLNNKVIVDFRNIYNPTELTAMGFKYLSLGRQKDD